MITLTREEIYRMVWDMPMTEIAKKYTISDVGFRKLCIRLKVPFPKAGYWSKIKAGHQVEQATLTKIKNDGVTVTLDERPPEQPVKKVSELDVLTKKMALEKLPFKVPGRLHNPAPLVIEARQSLKELTDPNYPGMMITGKGQLDIRVSPSNAGRALRFMDTFIKCIKARGHRLVPDIDGTYVLIRNVKLKITFRERTNRSRTSGKAYQEYEWRPNGKVVFRIDGRLKSEWGDLKSKLLEEQLPRIVAKMELAAKQEELYQEKARLWQQNWERERKAKAEFEARQKKEREAFKELMKNAKHWKQAGLIREYIAAKHDADPNWLAWASAKADWLDPYIALEDSWLTEVDKDAF
jgi:hypothetical protein